MCPSIGCIEKAIICPFVVQNTYVYRGEYLLGLYRYDVLDLIPIPIILCMLFPIATFQSTDTMNTTHICCY